ncbi:hypothetical protein [Vibrio cholerae]|uniref:hypothetical protein n=1 Tax=Vibrio cholerae TaxID=666 RepID=UPI0013B38780|nr:hypothetical protein [Vibrio cholerae]MCX9450457.1 hypothetical protein [Vibrio cholerae]
MTTMIDVLDTAVKIGLGAAITGFVAIKGSKISHKQELEKVKLEGRKQLVFQLTEHLENVESLLNQCIIAKNSERNVLKSKEILMELCSQGYKARAIANLLGSSELVGLISCICKDAEDIYPLLFDPNNSIEDLNSSINQYKLATYPVIQKMYQGME